MGNKLFSEVTALTGLPEELIGEELKDLLERKGINPEQMTMDSLRDALAEYLTSIHESMEQAEASSITTESVEIPKSRLPTQ